MKLQAHIPGEMSGQVPNQAGSQLSGLAQLNGSALSHQMPPLGGVPRSTINMDPELLRARAFIQDKIFDMLLQRQQQPVTDLQRKKLKDLAKRLEEGMLKAALSKEDYMNLDTLESRLSNFLRRASMNNHNQQYPQLVNSSPIGTMIPTPGMSHVPNSSMMVASSMDASMISASGCNSIASTPFNNVNMLPAGSLSNGYQQSSTSFSVASGGNISSMGVQRMASQMIPTPGFTVSSNHSHMNIDSNTNGGAFSSAESTMVPQSQQKQHVGGQNSHVLQNFSSQMGSGMRSGLLQKPFTNSNGAINSGSGLIGNNIQLAHEPGTSENFASTYANSPKHLQQHFDQNQKPVVQGDGYGMNNVDTFASGNLYTSATSSGPMMNNQNTNSVKLPSIPKTSSLISDGLMHSQQQYQQRTQQLQQPDQYMQQQFQSMQNQQPQHVVNSDAFGQSQLASNLENRVKSEPGIEHHKEVLNSHVSDQFHMSEMQSQFQQNSTEDCSRGVGSQSKSVILNQWPQSQDCNHTLDSISHDQHLRLDFHQRISGQDEAQCNNLSSDGSIIGRAVLSRGSAEQLDSGSAIKKAHRNQQRWLLFLLHARRCSAPEGRCKERFCSIAQKLCKHIDGCTLRHCPYPQNVGQTSENAAGTKSGKPKIKGVSLTELFTPEQVREHITGLRQWVGQASLYIISKSKAEKNQAMEHSMSENSCQLCAVEKLTFEPPPIYCTTCGVRIKRNNMYYTTGTGDTRHYFCIPCYNDARTENIIVDGTPIAKSRLEKKKNDEETEEWWVQCDKCEAWQHQICALFNGRRNDGGQAEYTCPNCYIQEVERGERKPLPQSALLGAKDLPRTILSDHIEQRLFRRLKQEKQERARIQGKSCDEIPGAEALVVRVVSSVDKKLEVKPRFLEIFQEENYPTEFPYKSKVILLFQKIEGVEVCLFGMYVQEFGSECQFPNQRRVYLSYLDSVKYFRPEVKAVTGEALRTFVYHEILIGYLEYCKKRGFTSCYIWACPPLKGEDYILYCHPEIQKTPKSDKLREWYLSMLRKAAKENIVVDLTNLYDHFFISTGECRAKVTAARLPYFDGDYWPGAAEDLIYQLRQEEDGRKQNKKGTTKKTITKRALKASGQSDLSGNASKDLLLMHKLGETICPMKEDFIMVHLQHACTSCCILMVSGKRWVCNQCKNFQICDKCYDAELKREERERHPTNQREKHTLYPVEITDVPSDTKDRDDILESEFFDTRQAFLSLCQGNHYQYDTLRRAKHSSMMVLYHLHNPTAPAFVTTCNICYLDIETGQGWRCEVCPEYDVCNACYQKGGIDHPHKLTNHPSMVDRDAQNKEARQLRVLQVI
uniref:histone acetyltransferase n=1 Tax=Cajanus cajan TaxID=3821 RepID=A0A151SGK7_CAJCA|nr:Histone acetyltransferase HAC1 [Cajanus cajan]